MNMIDELSHGDKTEIQYDETKPVTAENLN